MSLQQYVAAKNKQATASIARSNSALAEDPMSLHLPPRFAHSPTAQHQPSTTTLRGESNPGIFEGGHLSPVNRRPVSTIDSRPPMGRTDSMASVISVGTGSILPSESYRSFQRSMSGLGTEAASASGGGYGYTSAVGDVLLEGPMLRSGQTSWRPCYARAVLSHTGVGGKLLLFKDQKAENPTDALDFADVVRVSLGPSTKASGMFSSKSTGFRYEIKIEGATRGFPAIASDTSAARDQWIGALDQLVPRVTSGQAAKLLMTNAQYERSAAQLEGEIERLKHEAAQREKQFHLHMNEMQAKVEEERRNRDRIEGELHVLRQQRQQAAAMSSSPSRSHDSSAVQLDQLQKMVQSLAKDIRRNSADQNSTRTVDFSGEATAPLRRALLAELSAKLEVGLDNAIDSIVNSTSDLLRTNGTQKDTMADISSQIAQLHEAVDQGSRSVIKAIDDVQDKMAKLPQPPNQTTQPDFDSLVAQIKPRLKGVFADFEASMTTKLIESSKKVTDGLSAMAASNKHLVADTALDNKNLVAQLRDSTRDALEAHQEKLAGVQAAVESLRENTRPALERFSAGVVEACVQQIAEQLRSQLGPLADLQIQLQESVNSGLGMLRSDLAAVVKTDQLQDLEAKIVPSILSAIQDNTDRVNGELARLADAVAAGGLPGSPAYPATLAASIRSPSPTFSMFGDRDQTRIEKIREVVEDAIGEALAEERKRTTTLEKANVALIGDKIASLRALFEEHMRVMIANDRKAGAMGGPHPTSSTTISDEQPRSIGKSMGANLSTERLATETRSQLNDIESKVSRLEKEQHQLHDIQEGWLKQLMDSMRHLRKDVSELAVSERERDRYIRDLTAGAYGNRSPGQGAEGWPGSGLGGDVAEMIRESYLSLQHEIRALKEAQIGHAGAAPQQGLDATRRPQVDEACVGTDTEGVDKLAKQVKQLEEQAAYLVQHVQDLEETAATLETEKARMMADLQAISHAKKEAWNGLRKMESRELLGSDSTLHHPQGLLKAPAANGSYNSDSMRSRLRELFDLRGAIRNELSQASLKIDGLTVERSSSRKGSGNRSGFSTSDSDLGVDDEQPFSFATGSSNSGNSEEKRMSGKAKRVISGLWQKALGGPHADRAQ